MIKIKTIRDNWEKITKTKGEHSTTSTSYFTLHTTFSLFVVSGLKIIVPFSRQIWLMSSHIKTQRATCAEMFPQPVVSGIEITHNTHCHSEDRVCFWTEARGGATQPASSGRLQERKGRGLMLWCNCKRIEMISMINKVPNGEWE